jgi:competence protein ComEC
LAVWGLPANLIVAPLSSFVIMPFLALGTALEGLGWGGPFLRIAGWGVDAMVAVARQFESLGGQAVVPSAPSFTLVVAFVGVMLLCLWQGRLRWLGLPLAMAVLVWPRPPAPLIWVAADGSAAAVRREGDAIALRPDARRFGVELWARRRGLALTDGGDFICDRWTCRPGPGAAAALSLSWSRRSPQGEALALLCGEAEVVVLRGPVPADPPEVCAGRVVLSEPDFNRGGAAELYRRPDGWWIVWAQPLRGQRPWS